MGIAYEFLREEASSAAGPVGLRKDFEGTLNFIIDNYFELMRVYRAVHHQLDETDAKKVKAHTDLKALRIRKNNLTPTATEAEKEAMAEEKRVLTKKLTEEDEIKYEGESLSEDDCRLNVVCQYSFLFKRLEKVDNLARWPLRKTAEWLTNRYPDLKQMLPKI